MEHPVDPHRVRRQAVLMLAVVNALVLGTGIVASIDLSRLRTPGGTALRWVEAAVFGNCDDYLTYSVADASTDQTRSEAEVCHDLRSATATSRSQQLRIGLRLDGVRRTGQEATAELTLTRDGRPAGLHVHLVHRGGRWRVLRDVVTCDSVGCA